MILIARLYFRQLEKYFEPKRKSIITSYVCSFVLQDIPIAICQRLWGAPHSKYSADVGILTLDIVWGSFCA